MGWSRILRHRRTASCGVCFLHLAPGLTFIHRITTQIDENRHMGLYRVLSHMHNKPTLAENKIDGRG